MSTENKPPVETNDEDITYAQKLLRELSGAEPYAAYVMPTARMIASIRKDITEKLLNEMTEHLEYDDTRDNYCIAPFAWRAFTKKWLDPFVVKP